MGEFPVEVLPERVFRTYCGGRLLEERAGRVPAVDGNYPEEWILSTVEAVSPDGKAAGLCKALWGGQTAPLRELSGPLGVLVKVIDSAERLSVQVHPDRRRAAEYFHSLYGKTESWHILGKREPDACIYMGFRPGITREQWRLYFERQDIAAMLGCMHRIFVEAGETYLIPGGLPHAIGAGCLLLEIQEPTDITLRVECATASGERIPGKLIHQGIGCDRMFDCFDYRGMDMEELLSRYRIGAAEDSRDGVRWSRLIGRPQTDCFSLLFREVSEEIPGGILIGPEARRYGLYVWDGEGELTCEGARWPLKPGSQFYIPSGCLPFLIRAKRNLKIYRIEEGESCG